MKNIQIMEAGDTVMISIDGCEPFVLSEEKFRRISNVIEPKKLTTEERTSAVLECTARFNGATIEEVAMFQDNGEQNCYNPIFRKLEEEGVIFKNGDHRKTRRNRPAAVYVLNNGGYYISNNGAHHVVQ